MARKSASDIIYARLDREASAIVTKLKNEIAEHGYRENIGQKELMHYTDKVNAHFQDLTFQERFQLTHSLTITINNL